MDSALYTNSFLGYRSGNGTGTWAVLQGQLYVAGQKGVGRWSETLQTWEYPMNGLPMDTSDSFVRRDTTNEHLKTRDYFYAYRVYS